MSPEPWEYEGESWKLGNADPDLTEGLDSQGPSADDLDRFGNELETCPECGGFVYDQTDVCQRCGHAIHREDEVPTWAGWLASILIVVIFILGGGGVLLFYIL